MSPFHRPGWALPNGHVVRSNMEAALCEYLSAVVEPHVHSGLSFDVPIGPNRWMLYTPSIVLTQSKKDGRTIVIEAIDSPHPGGGARRLRGFREKHGQAYCLIIVARRTLHHEIPDQAYDFIFPLEDFARLDQFLTELR